MMASIATAIAHSVCVTVVQPEGEPLVKDGRRGGALVTRRGLLLLLLLLVMLGGTVVVVMPAGRRYALRGVALVRVNGPCTGRLLVLPIMGVVRRWLCARMSLGLRVVDGAAILMATAVVAATIHGEQATTVGLLC